MSSLKLLDDSNMDTDPHVSENLFCTVRQGSVLCDIKPELNQTEREMERGRGSDILHWQGLNLSVRLRKIELIPTNIEHIVAIGL